jgi:hypothetical protein
MGSYAPANGGNGGDGKPSDNGCNTPKTDMKVGNHSLAVSCGLPSGPRPFTDKEADKLSSDQMATIFSQYSPESSTGLKSLFTGIGVGAALYGYSKIIQHIPETGDNKGRYWRFSLIMAPAVMAMGECLKSLMRHYLPSDPNQKLTD